MGDRANVYVTDGANPGVFLYSHWGGTKFQRHAVEILAQPTVRVRWGDAPYLTRILFGRLVDDHEGTTGYGISTRMPDNEHPVLVVNTNALRWYFVDEGEHDGPVPPTALPFGELVP